MADPATMSAQVLQVYALQTRLSEAMDMVFQFEQQAQLMQQRINNQRRELRRLNASNKRFIDGAKAFNQKAAQLRGGN